MKTRNIIIVMVTTLICFLLVALVFVYASALAAKNIARNISAEFKTAFNLTPVVSINNRVVVSESHSIAELATASKTISVDTALTSTWLHSTKKISLRGVFVAKAGFDLSRTFKIDFATNPKGVTVTLPNPRILSVEMVSNEITDEKGGVINWLSPADHEAALKQLTDEARLEITDSSIRQAARDEMEKRIREMGALKGLSVKFQYDFGSIMPEPPKE